MPERALAKEAGAALDVQPQYARAGGLRRCVFRAGRSEQRHLRPAEGSGDVHEAGIVADDEFRAGDERERFVQGRFPDQVRAADTSGRLEILSGSQNDRRKAQALVPAGPSGRAEPLCAIYHRLAYPALRAAFDAGVRKIWTAVERLPAVTFPIGELTPFQNVNTPEDWAGYGTY